MQQTEYLALSMVDGHVQFHVNLGSGSATLRSKNQNNDGQWHRVEAARQKRQAIIKVDIRAHPSNINSLLYLRNIIRFL